MEPKYSLGQRALAETLGTALLVLVGPGSVVATLVLAGTEDQNVPISHAAHAKERIRGARVVMLPGDHNAQVTRAREVWGAVLASTATTVIVFIPLLLVRPHWRQQWYASEQRHAPRWIEGYIKGPADKPLVLRAGALDYQRYMVKHRHAEVQP